MRSASTNATVIPNVVRRAGTLALTVTEDASGFSFTTDNTFFFPGIIAVAVRFTPASGVSETLALPEMEAPNFTKQFGPVDLADLGVPTAEALLFVNGIETPFIDSGAIVDSVTITSA